MEPERDIEKELKAYAQQRRAAAGTPPPLHPANRKALQAEAARLAKSPDGQSRSWWRIFFGSWPGMAVAGATAAVVVIATLHLLPGPESKRETFQSLAATRQPAEEPKAAPAPPPQPMALAADRKTDAAKSSSFAASADNLPQPASAATPAVAAAPPTALAASREVEASKSSTFALDAEKSPQPTPVAAPAPVTPPVAQSLALKTASPQNRDASSSLGQPTFGARAQAPQAAAASGGAPAGAVAPFYRLTTADAPAAPVTQRFRRTGLSAKSARPAGTAGWSNLLNSFRVEQELDKLRVIDSDGSVYFGFVEQTPEAAKETEGLMAKKLAPKDTAQDKPAQPLQTFHFRVSGTNRTLKEAVVFTGNFLTTATPQTLLKRTETTADIASGPRSSLVTTNAIGFATPATVAPAAAARPVLFDLGKAKMEGRLLVGQTNKVEIIAVPAKR